MTVDSYPARFEINYPEEGLNRLTALFRLFLAIPPIVLLFLLPLEGAATSQLYEEMNFWALWFFSIPFLPVVFLLLFRRKYPRWWFNWALELGRFESRVIAYIFLLRDEYPSTGEKQAVHLDLDYPDAARDLNRWLPLVKWLLVIPHLVVLLPLLLFSLVGVVIAWFAILFTGRYPRGIFDFVVGVSRWLLRVEAYALLLVTDRYPPFSLAA